ncbi:MAG: recombinase family protein [Lachnospira sp.]|nr:recombinase family protein [Lachnospira sp.]
MQQKTQRQIDNIKSFDTNAIIYEEKQSGKDIENRAIFKKLLDKVKSGDTIIFDEVSRMSRNADEGYNLYMELMQQNINLVFLKERHIDTDEYKRRTQNHIARVSSSNEKMDNLINGILDLVADFEKENLKDNIRLAFQQAEHERLFLIKRVTEGKSRSEKPQGRPEGSHNIKNDKAELIKKIIIEQSKDFDGKFSDAKIMKEYLQGVARNTYYKYKKELKES